METKFENIKITKKHLLDSNIYTKNIITIDGCIFASGTLKYLTKELKNNQNISILEIINCTIKPLNMYTITKMLKVNTGLDKLVMNDCNITDDSLEILVMGLKKNNTLQHLELSDNLFPISLNFANIIKYNAGLKTIIATGLDEEIACNNNFIPLYNALIKNKTLQYLNLSNCYLRDDDNIIFNALSRNYNLEKLNITDNYVDYKMLANNLINNHTLKKLIIDSPRDESEFFFETIFMNNTIQNLKIRNSINIGFK